MPHDVEIIKYIREKDSSESSGFKSPIYFGTKPRFISATRNSSLNNLEEQLIFGTDDYVVTYKDENDNTIIEQSFRTNNKFSDYYHMISTIYKDDTMYGDVGFDGTDLDISEKLGVHFGGEASEYPDINAVYFPNDRFSIVDDPVFGPSLFIGDPLGGYNRARDDELWWVKGDNDKIKVLTKSTGVKHLGGSTLTYSRIENLLDNTSEP